ncbi:hypothetical protein ABZZ47_34015 [Streptomyces sp. NPDC006465]|uniref:hypothetical protein n=1 Tax=Streptomyces sp. NPDC006465 TaxID=3157174 RepID=UPI0033A43C46
MPAAASLVALAGAHVRRQGIAPGVSGQMFEHRGACRCGSEQHASVVALLAHKLWPSGTRP